jgi:hypothetical protein
VFPTGYESERVAEIGGSRTSFARSFTDADVRLVAHTDTLLPSNSTPRSA